MKRFLLLLRNIINIFEIINFIIIYNEAENAVKTNIKRKDEKYS